MRNKIFIVALVGICALMQGCRSAEEKKEMGPEEVAESFCRAVAGGDFGQAWALCDTVAMKSYLDGQKEARTMLEKQDSSASGIASQILSEIEFVIDDIVKEGEERHLFCSIGFDGNKKGKLIILKKEEGEWKVKETADRP